MQPWTPCLPIRGGKIKTSKNYSSNPQLSFGCTSSPIVNPKIANNTSANSLNSSYIWREASPNNFNLYSSSVSSLNAAAPSSRNQSIYRYSLGANSRRSPEWRAVSEEKGSPSRKSNKSKVSSHYENVMMPLLSGRKHKPVKIFKSSLENVYLKNVGRRLSNEPDESDDRMPYGLYDRRTNRSFETPSKDSINVGNNIYLRRSTPHLASETVYPEQENRNQNNRHSATWCCGSFMLKQWKKMNNYD